MDTVIKHAGCRTFKTRLYFVVYVYISICISFKHNDVVDKILIVLYTSVCFLIRVILCLMMYLIFSFRRNFVQIYLINVMLSNSEVVLYVYELQNHTDIIVNNIMTLL